MSPVCCLRSRQMSSRALPAPAKAGVPGTHPSTSPGRPAALALARRAFPSPRRGGGRGGVNVWRNRRRLSKTSVRSRASSGPGTRSAPIRHREDAVRPPFFDFRGSLAAPSDDIFAFAGASRGGGPDPCSLRTPDLRSGDHRSRGQIPPPAPTFGTPRENDPRGQEAGRIREPEGPGISLRMSEQSDPSRVAPKVIQ